MKKSFIITLLIITVIALSVTVSPLATRITYEKNNTSLTAALNLNCVGALFEDEALSGILEEYKAAGINAALIRETDALSLEEAGLISYFTYDNFKKKHIAPEGIELEKNSFIIVCENDEGKAYLENAFSVKYPPEAYSVFETDGKTAYGIFREIASPEAITFPPEERLFRIAEKAGLPIALSLEDNSFVSDSYRKLIKAFTEKYDVKYFNPTKHEKVQAKFRYNPEAPGEWEWMLENTGRILVLNETITQLSNQKPDGYDKYIELSEGRIQRCFKTYKSSYIDRPEYDIGYYQMLNSLADRNIRFFNISQLNDGDDDLYKKAERTCRAISKFTKKAASIGYQADAVPSFKGYETSLRLISAAAVLLMLVMALLCCYFFFGARKRKYEIIILVCSLSGIAGAFILPFNIMLLYSMVFAIAAPCFALMAATEFADATRNHFNGFVYGILNILFTVLLLSILGGVMSALLSGRDYYLNTLTFKGVKTSLSAPLLLSGLLFIICKRESRGYKLRKIPKIKKSDIRPSHIILGAGALLIIGIYLLRSGNAKISFEEIWFRNFITEKLIARPRTKEFLFAWPCYVLFLYFLKTEKSPILTALCGVGASILFASVINTFCHVFTPVTVMELRVIYGGLFGLAVSLPLLGIAALFFFIAEKRKNH